MLPRLLLVPLVLACVAGHAIAQEVRLYRADEGVDPRDVAQILDSTIPGAPGMKMRSIRLLDDTSAKTSAPQPTLEVHSASAAPEEASGASRPAKSPTSAALALPVQFGFDSADILPSARRQLDALAEGIRLLPAGRSVVIEGHTDAVGTDGYNDQLSQRRAHAVRSYLVAMHHIEPARLKAVGMGKHGPLPGRDPVAPENRRVQFRGE